MKNEGTAQVHEGTARRYCSKISGLFEDVIMKKIEYCLFDVVVEFH
ncbi:hypothetical protein Tco_1473983, partial [Tanacetum coccineum]